ncbi:MAG: hypothetical protein WC578_00080 [Candidatus Omnitrophota bacterium]|jgi:uncharacterized Fe-S center protein
MKSKVYFIPADASDNIQSLSLKVRKLLEKSNLLDFIRKKDKAWAYLLRLIL